MYLTLPLAEITRGRDSVQIWTPLCGPTQKHFIILVCYTLDYTLDYFSKKTYWIFFACKTKPLNILDSWKMTPLIILGVKTIPFIFWPPVKETLGYSGSKNYTLGLKKIPLIISGLWKRYPWRPHLDRHPIYFKYLPPTESWSIHFKN